MAQLDKRLQARKLPRSLPPDEFDQDLSQLATQEKRILDAYREEVITLQELRAQKDQIATRRKVLEAKKYAALRQADGPGQPEITMAVLGETSPPDFAVPWPKLTSPRANGS